MAFSAPIEPLVWLRACGRSQALIGRVPLGSSTALVVAATKITSHCLASDRKQDSARVGLRLRLRLRPVQCETMRVERANKYESLSVFVAGRLSLDRCKAHLSLRSTHLSDADRSFSFVCVCLFVCTLSNNNRLCGSLTHTLSLSSTPIRMAALIGGLADR